MVRARRLIKDNFPNFKTFIFFWLLSKDRCAGPVHHSVGRARHEPRSGRGSQLSKGLHHSEGQYLGTLASYMLKNGDQLSETCTCGPYNQTKVVLKQKYFSQFNGVFCVCWMIGISTLVGQCPSHCISGCNHIQNIKMERKKFLSRFQPKLMGH